MSAEPTPDTPLVRPPGALSEAPSPETPTRPKVDILDEAQVSNEHIVALVLALILEQREGQLVDQEEAYRRVQTYIPSLDDEVFDDFDPSTAPPKTKLQFRTAALAHRSPRTHFEMTTAMQQSPSVRFIESSLQGHEHTTPKQFRTLQRVLMLLAGSDIRQGNDEINRLTREITYLLLRPEPTHR